MNEKYVVIHGGTCKCKFSEEPKTDILLVKSQKKHFANDKDAEKKLIATTKELELTLQKNTFGKCKLQPAGSGNYLPCQAVINKWTGFYEKITLSNQGKILLEDSKATCPIGGPDCIEIVNHGQKAEVGKSNFKSADPDLHSQINPLIDMAEFQASLDENYAS